MYGAGFSRCVVKGKVDNVYLQSRALVGFGTGE